MPGRAINSEHSLEANMDTLCLVRAQGAQNLEHELNKRNKHDTLWCNEVNNRADQILLVQQPRHCALLPFMRLSQDRALLKGKKNNFAALF